MAKHRMMVEEGEESHEGMWMARRGGGSQSQRKGGGGAHRRGDEEGFVGLGAQRYPRRATTLAAGTAAFLLLSACLPGAHSVKCFHGILTVGEGGKLVTDSAYWQSTVNDPTAGQSKDCSVMVDQFHNTCSMFCKTYETLTSEIKMHECRRFCMTGAQCKKSFEFQAALCEAEMQRPKGNRKLITCTLKCDVTDDSNLYPECGKVPDTGYTSVTSNSTVSVNSGYTRCATLGASAAHHTVQAGWFLAAVAATMVMLLQ